MFCPLHAFHLKFPFIAKAHEKHGMHLSVQGILNKPTSSRASRHKTQDFSYYAIGFPDLDEKHCCGFSLIFIPLHLSCWASGTVILVNHRCVLASTLRPLDRLWKSLDSLCCFVCACPSLTVTFPI